MGDVKINIDQLKRLRSNIEQMDKSAGSFFEKCGKELAARLIAKAVERTPVDTGELQRAWSTNGLKVNHVGSNFIIQIINPKEYASYVEYGHRTVNHKGWVPGKLMLTISEEEIRQSAPGILETKLQKWLSGAIK